MTYSLEAIYEIWDDKYGTKIQVKQDSDCLGLGEIRQNNNVVTFPKEKIQLLIKALQKLEKDLNDESSDTST